MEIFATPLVFFLNILGEVLVEELLVTKYAGEELLGKKFVVRETVLAEDGVEKLGNVKGAVAGLGV